MKKTISLLVLMLMVSMMASAQDSFAKQFKGKEGFSCVTIGKAAMKMMSSRGTLGREGFSDKLNIGSFADKVERLEIVSASTPETAEELVKACNKWIERDGFESILDVDEGGQQASIYAKTGESAESLVGNNMNVFLLLAQDQETSVIIIYGTMTLEDIKGITASNYQESKASMDDPLSTMYGKARDFYLLARDGDPEAQYQLASCYHSGYGVEENDSLAFEWAKKSAEQNYPAGLYFLAFCYETGKGCSANMGNANTLYKKAYEKAMLRTNDGDPSAQFVLGKIYDYGNGGVEQNQEIAVRWYLRAAEQGYPGAQFNLGNCYQLGEGVKEDKEQAVYWYRQAAIQGDADSQYMLGLCYASGEGITKSTPKAIEWFQKSSQQGHRLAQDILLRIGENW